MKTREQLLAELAAATTASAKKAIQAQIDALRTTNTTAPSQADADAVDLTVSENVANDGTPVADSAGANRATQPNLDNIDKLLLAIGYDTNYNALKLARAGMNESALIKANRQFLSDLMLKIPEQYIANYNQNVDYIDELLSLFEDGSKSVPVGAGYFENASNLPLVSNPEYAYLPKNQDGSDKFKFPKFSEKVSLIDLEKIIWINVAPQEIVALFHSKTNLESIVSRVLSQLQVALKLWLYNFTIGEIINWDYQTNELVIDLSDKNKYPDAQSTLRGLVNALLDLRYLNRRNMLKTCDVETSVNLGDLKILSAPGLKASIDISLFATLFNSEAMIRGMKTASFELSQIIELPRVRAINDAADQRITDGKILFEKNPYIDDETLYIVEKGAFTVDRQYNGGEVQNMIYYGTKGIDIIKYATVLGVNYHPWRHVFKVKAPQIRTFLSDVTSA